MSGSNLHIAPARCTTWKALLPLVLLTLAVPTAPAQGVAAVLRAAEAELAVRFPQDAPHLQVRVLRTSGSLPVHPAPTIRFPAEGALPRGRTQVRIHPPDAPAQQGGWALLYVAHFDSVVIARTTVPAGKVLQAEDLEIAWMETTSFRGTPLRADALRSMRQSSRALLAARPLRAGRALRQGDLRPPYAVDTGEPVEMQYQRLGMVLRLACEAREPGFAGDVIRLYSDDTRTMYRARLTEAGRAEWIETL